MDLGSEFLDNLLQRICKGMYQGLWDSTEALYSYMQGILADGITKSHDAISKTPQEWNSSAFSFIQTVTENAVIPIAGCMLVFIFCWQLISMVQESNQMHNIKPETILLLMLKLGICLLVCSKSFEIVNGLFDLAKWAVDHIPTGFSSDSGTYAEFGNVCGPRELNSSYSFGNVFTMFGNLILTLIAEVFTYVLVVAIYIRVNVWYLELLIYTSAAPMPFSTFMNKEWGQMGMNYLRKILAMAFEGFFMLVAFGLYSAITGQVLGGFASAGNSYLMNMVTSIGCGVALLLIISKAGTISSSVFNAH